VCVVLQATYKLIFGAKFGFLTITLIWENKEYKEKIYRKYGEERNIKLKSYYKIFWKKSVKYDVT